MKSNDFMRLIKFETNNYIINFFLVIYKVVILLNLG